MLRFFLRQFRVQTVATAMNATGSVQTIPQRTHTRALFPVAHFTRDCTCGSRANRLKTICLRASEIMLSSVMSLLGVHSTPLLPVFSSPSTAQTTPATSPALSTGIRLHPCATPLGDGLSGRLAGPIPNTTGRKKTTPRSGVAVSVFCQHVCWCLDVADQLQVASQARDTCFFDTPPSLQGRPGALREKEKADIIAIVMYWPPRPS